MGFLIILASGCGSGNEQPDDVILPSDEDGDGYSTDADCDDADASVTTESSRLYLDADGDGYGDDADVDGDGVADFYVDVCPGESLDGYVATGGDCDDSHPDFHPGATEEDCEDPNDYNCDDSVGYSDADDDGFAACVDCDDSEGEVHPENAEWCDGVDNDCDGNTDEPTAEDAERWYDDADADGYGSMAPGESEVACEQPEGSTADGTDCDDEDAAINPGEDEVCDTDDTDEDCDDLINDEDPDVMGTTDWHTDADIDGFGDPDSFEALCEQPDDYETVDDATDCDDADAAINPDETEICDASSSVDENCDGLIDDDDPAVDPDSQTTFYDDIDGDGYGLASAATLACTAPANTSTIPGDCDDVEIGVNPGETEVCDAAETDEDCDGVADDADNSVSTSSMSTFYTDSDLDGYGDADADVQACHESSGVVPDDTDCLDSDVDTNPAATEVCGNGIDNDCDSDATDCITSGTVSLSTAPATIEGDGAGANLGFSVAAGEVTGDDTADALVGTPDYGNTTGEGGACLVEGPLLGTYQTTADCYATFVGDSVGSWGGWSLAIGDGDADGENDVAIGSYYSEYISLFYGPIGTGTYTLGTDDDARYNAESGAAAVGNSMAFVGNVLGGTESNLAVQVAGHNVWRGAVYVLSADDSSDNDLSDSEVIRTGYGSFEAAGNAIDGCDIDGDGTNDLIAGAPYATAGGSGRGYVYIEYGPLTTGTAEFEATYDSRIGGKEDGEYLGSSLACVGDVDGDGLEDFLVGAVGQNDGGFEAAGGAYLFLGSLSSFDTTSASASATILGSSYDQELGYKVSAAGDWDDDGLPDVAVAAFRDDISAVDAGAIFVFPGTTRGTVADTSAQAIFTGINAGANTGIALTYSPYPLLQDDLFGSLIMGAWYDDPTAGTDAGSAQVVSAGSGI